MYKPTEDELQQIRIWDNYAQAGYLQSTIDPRDTKGLKCDYIDYWSRYYIKKFVLFNSGINILEIGCGSGRNLFALAPYLKQGYGIDLALEQIKNAESYRRQLGLTNISFFSDPEAFFENKVSIQSMFTMWVLAGFNADQALGRMLSFYIDKLFKPQRFVFFEQIAENTQIVEEKGTFYKKVRTKDDYLNLFTQVGLELKEFKVINEKGFGPFYRLLYMTRLYQYWPAWLRFNKLLFFLDRHLVTREIADTFTDCVFICERKNKC